MDKIASEATSTVDKLEPGASRECWNEGKAYLCQNMDYKTYLHLARITHIGSRPTLQNDHARNLLDDWARFEGTTAEWKMKTWLGGK